MNVQLPLDFSVGYTLREEESPREWIPACVPGAVQLDYAKARGWGDYRYGDHYKQYAPLEDWFWHYRAQLPDFLGQRAFFVSKGIDYRFRIQLGGQVLLEQEGMFTPVELELTGLAKAGDILEILIFPVPKSVAEPADRQQADHCVKPACSYGWDWHPRLIPSGIWDETYIELREERFLENPGVTYTLSEDLQHARLTLHNGADAVWSLYAPDGSPVFENRQERQAEVAQPLLWWCSGQGEQPLYTAVIRLFQGDRLLDEKRQRIGFRRAKLVMHEFGWQEPAGGVDFPAGRKSPPMTLELNGRVIFAKGTNWVPPEIFYGLITKETYRPQLQLAKDAHMNILRCWGGQIIQKESFYELCDELGLMVWQEFPLSCNYYADDQAYLDVLQKESISVISRLRLHPCLVLWSGGNELFCSWSKNTDQSHALRMLNSNCYLLDRDTPFIPTSPLMDVGHGDYTFRNGRGQEVYQIMAGKHCTAYCEFGVPGPSSPEYIASFIPEPLQKMPRPHTPWQDHHAFNAYPAHGWLQLHNIEHYFGRQEDYKCIYELGSWLQWEGYKAIYEEARRQKPVCGMALNWCYNEPWPTAANNSLLNYPALPKAGYYGVQEALRPVLASAAIEKFEWHMGEKFTITLWLLNDSYTSPHTGTVTAFIRLGNKKISLGEWQYPAPEQGKNVRGPVLSCLLPETEAAFMELVLEAGEYSSCYKLYYNRKKELV